MRKRTREERALRLKYLYCLLLFLLTLLFAFGLGSTATSQEVQPPVVPVTTAVVEPPVEPPRAEPEPEEEQVIEVVAVNYSSLDSLEYLGTFTATAYCHCVECCGIWSAEHPSRPADYVQKTRSGTVPEAGRTIAADWNIIPEGTEVVLEGHPYIVEDTGSAIKGNRIDIFYDDHGAANEWGVREVDLYTPRDN